MLRKLLQVQLRHNLNKFCNNPNLRQISYAKPKSNNVSKKIPLYGMALGIVAGTGYSIYKLNEPRGHILSEQIVIPMIKNAPKYTPSRSIAIPSDKTGLKLTLFQYQTCPFCCKVRAFLDYHGISYEVVEVDPVLRQATKWSTYKKVPILLAEVDGGYQPLNDSTMIISSLATYLYEDQSLRDIVQYYPYLRYQAEDGSEKNEIMNRYFLMYNQEKVKNRTKEDMNEERKWRMWADDVLVHDLSPNVYRTKAEALQAFNWFSEVGDWERQFPSWERNLIIYVGSMAMLLIGKRLKKRHNLKDDVRESLYDHCDEWVTAIRNKGTEFMGGSAPNLADLAVYGVLSSIEGCDAFKDLSKETGIMKWYGSMKAAVKNHGGSQFV
ncbi:PREDICTED: prostaglandin E synthase 2 [Nicrophorus vespilloides]|uniref:Prostaglandin E synthase 2 n=1 Tax=Nicrophorus vespilloides TaxID=110193 RepID=A0ABM1MTU6_NICVS|nr:PREDICTED: prostaglandin E synthase 2 [Nicrophorus vespilloides]